MSHAARDGTTCEPNLTPLLDLVLQILMFFIIAVKFVSNQVSTDIQLPDAQSARPMDKDEIDVLFLNMNSQGKVSVLEKPQPMELLETKYYLKQVAEDAQRNSKDGKVNIAVVLRADRNADYAQVYQVLQMCKASGFRKLNLRAISKA